MAEEEEGREKELKQQQDKSWLKEAIFFYYTELL